MVWGFLNPLSQGKTESSEVKPGARSQSPSLDLAVCVQAQGPRPCPGASPLAGAGGTGQQGGITSFLLRLVFQEAPLWGGPALSQASH